MAKGTPDNKRLQHYEALADLVAELVTSGKLDHVKHSFAKDYEALTDRLAAVIAPHSHKEKPPSEE